MKKFFIVIGSIILGIGTVIFMFVAKDFFFISAIVVLIVFAFYWLWRPPQKHKDYSLSDQQKATTRALGGGSTSDLLDIKPGEQKPQRKKH